MLDILETMLRLLKAITRLVPQQESEENLAKYVKGTQLEKRKTKSN